MRLCAGSSSVVIHVAGQTNPLSMDRQTSAGLAYRSMIASIWGSWGADATSQGRPPIHVAFQGFFIFFVTFAVLLAQYVLTGLV